MLIKIAHSPDSDDAFMFYGLTRGHVSHPDYQCQVFARDIEELNQEAKNEFYDITALSMHAYAHLTEQYVLTSSGASFAEKDYGPMVVAKKTIEPKKLLNYTVAIPGEWTTAFLLLKLFEPRIHYVVHPFHEIMPLVISGEVDAGLIIHEGQMQYEQMGLKKVLTVTDIWKEFAGDLPLPLGGSAIKKSLGKKVISDLSKLQKQSIHFALKNPAQSRKYAMSFKHDMTEEEAKKYLSWYANERSLEMGKEGKKAIQLLLDVAYDKGVLDKKVLVEIV